MSTRRPDTNFDDWMRGMERRMTALERRSPMPTPVVTSSGLEDGFPARQTSDWNGDDCAVNGSFFSAPSALNRPLVPDTTAWYIGSVMVDSNGVGMQRLSAYSPDFTAPVANSLNSRWSRTFITDGQGQRTYSTWRHDVSTSVAPMQNDVTITLAFPTALDTLTMDLNVASGEQILFLCDLDTQHNGTGTANLFIDLMQDSTVLFTADFNPFNAGGTGFRTHTAFHYLFTQTVGGTYTYRLTAHLGSTPDTYLVRHGESQLIAIRLP